MSEYMNRVAAWKSALLNTCVRLARPYYEEGTLILSNCLIHPDFRTAAYGWLMQPFFTEALEMEMEEARRELICDIEQATYDARYADE
jgi:hypothetical protein